MTQPANETPFPCTHLLRLSCLLHNTTRWHPLSLYSPLTPWAAYYITRQGDTTCQWDSLSLYSPPTPWAAYYITRQGDTTCQWDSLPLYSPLTPWAAYYITRQGDTTCRRWLPVVVFVLRRSVIVLCWCIQPESPALNCVHCVELCSVPIFHYTTTLWARQLVPNLPLWQMTYLYA